MHALVDDEPRAGHAGLPGRRENAGHQPVGRGPQVGVREHDLGGLAAQLQGHLVEVLRCGVRDRTAGRRRAGEGDLVDAAMAGQRGANLTREPRDHVEHPGREPGLLEQLGEAERGDRGVLRRLHHHGAARGQRGCDLPRHQQQGRVPRRDRRHDTHRLTPGVDEIVRVGRRDLPSLELVGQPGVVVVPAPKPVQLADHLAVQLAGVVDFQARKLLRMI